MTEDRVRRRLAATLAVDFSRMMEENEAGTLVRLEKY